MKELILCALFVTVTSEAWALPTYPNQVPNAPNGCGTCHLSEAGGGPRNLFGQAVQASLVTGQVNWSSLVDLDSDDDGFTNGEELGDPRGVWRLGDPRPRDFQGQLSDPGDPASTPLLEARGDEGLGNGQGGCRGGGPLGSGAGLPLLGGVLGLALRSRKGVGTRT